MRRFWTLVIMKVTSVERVLFKMSLPSHGKMTIITRWELCKSQILLGQNQFSLIAQDLGGEWTFYLLSAFKQIYSPAWINFVLVGWAKARENGSITLLVQSMRPNMIRHSCTIMRISQNFRLLFLRSLLVCCIQPSDDFSRRFLFVLWSVTSDSIEDSGSFGSSVYCHFYVPFLRNEWLV